ncbi:hypothetical protein JRO89_XS07G0208300 [Xanthoceras sorbifolium]|uniref:Uncharacterized protein n=1 Tax=Xanthoceras sorbifolium TaxID=99658 RepID=A0ABQ8HUG3_9ROSI|nr:hypothetical protein JRO89_XS07G0208300 [Xanthoceras sorbifolium]
MGIGRGNIAFQCNFCHQVYKGSYFRVKSHLLKIRGVGIASCSRVTNATLLELRKVVEEADLRVKQFLPRQVPFTSSMASESSSKTYSTGASNYYGLQMQLPNVEPKKKKGMNGPLEKAFNNSAREEFDGEIARMFYTCGFLFHFARNPHYVRAFTKAYNNLIAGYIPPGDGFDSMNMENVGILEIANLSLDEPDLEAVLFSSSGSDNVIVNK